jgi:hypothetical protein
MQVALGALLSMTDCRKAVHAILMTPAVPTVEAQPSCCTLQTSSLNRVLLLLLLCHQDSTLHSSSQ